jgi:NADH-quinone oxidoreductase subunit E
MRVRPRGDKMSEQTDMQVPDPAPEQSGEAVATPASDWAFSSDRAERFQELLRRYPTNLSAIMPTLWLCQEQWGWLRPGVPEWVAGRLEIPVSRVYEVITFYTMYYTEDPGKYNLQVCRNVSCHMMGARTIVNHLKDRLGIVVGETSSDGLFRLEEVECLGACGMAPMMQVGKHYYENLTPEKVDGLLDQWRRDG